MMAAMEVVGALLLLVLPGLAWSFVFLGRKEVGLTGRLAIGAALSLVMVPLASLFLNSAFGMGVTALSTGLVAVSLALIPLAYLIARNHWLHGHMWGYWRRRRG